MGYNLITVNAGHSAKAPGAGANGYKEHEMARKVKDKVIAALKKVGVRTVDTTSDADTQNAVLGEQVRKCNAQPRNGRLDVSIHFNSGGGTGSEVLYYDQKALAEKVAKAVSEAAGLTNRGAKERKDLYFLRKTNAPAILIEVGFIDNKSDMAKINTKMDAIANAIVKALTGKTVPTQSTSRSQSTSKSKSDGLYKVQTGAFKSKENAEELVRKLKSKGFDAHIVKE